MIISFSGTPGSGKSTIAKKLASKLGWPRYYMGGLRRETAKKMGLSLEEYNKLGEKDPSTDHQVDELQKELGKTKDNFIIDGRISWHFIPHSIKIYISVDPKVGAQRVFKNLENRNEAKNLKSWKDVLKSQKERIASDNQRYKRYYGLETHNPQNYDLCIDSTNLSLEEVLALVEDYIDKK